MAASSFTVESFASVSWGGAEEQAALDADAKANEICHAQDISAAQRLTAYAYRGQRCYGGWDRRCDAYAKATYACAQ